MGITPLPSIKSKTYLPNRIRSNQTTAIVIPTLYTRGFDDESSLATRSTIMGGSLSVFSLDDVIYYGNAGKSLSCSNNSLAVSHNCIYDPSRITLNKSIVLTTKIRLSNTANGNGPRIGIMGRINPIAGTGYAMIARPQAGNTTLRLSKFVGSTETAITTTDIGFQLTANAWYNLAFYMDGSNLKGKIWLDGDAEPSRYQLETVDTSYSDSYQTVGCCFFSNNTTLDKAWIDSIVESIADTTPPVVTTNLGDPFALTAPNFPSRNTHNLTPDSVIWAGFTAPFPTNKFFTNTFMDTNSDTVKFHPYNLQTRNDSLKVCYPGRTVASTYIIEGFLENLNIKATETLLNHHTEHWDQFSIKHRWVTSGAEYMESPLVKGSPYVSMYYSGLTPLITTIHAITSVNGSGFSGTFTGTKFKIVMNNGQTWIFYFDSSVTLTASTVGNYHLTATSAYTGWMRVACLITAGDEVVLDTYKGKIPTGATPIMSTAGDVAPLGITWTSTGTGTLAMCCLPHHQDFLTSPTPQSALQYRTMKGYMKVCYGDIWQWSEDLPTYGFNPPRSVDPSKLSAVSVALAADYTIIPSASDPYFGGKSVARSGELAIIADNLGETSKATTIRNNMKSVMNAWLTGTSNPNIIYESKWGGLCMERAITNQNADFTSGYYSDHHFHWGYWIYAAACLAKGDPAWMNTYKSYVNDFVREICNPSEEDPYYTVFRHYDWYESHSWASGLFKFGDGGNQESSSEAVNAWYAVYLWGLVTENDNIKNIGRILLAGEIRGAQKYWQIKSADNIYDAIFAANKVVGVLWQTKIDYATFFGANAEYIHEIQTIPITIMTELLLDPAWVTEEYPVLIANSINRSYPVATSISNVGATYIGANGGFFIGATEYQVADNVQVSGGTGSGLTFNINIRKNDGSLFEVFINQRGSGYTESDIVSLVSPSGGLSGGNGGARIRLAMAPEDGWKGFIYAKHGVIDKATAWTEAQSLSSYDGGNTKTNLLWWLATRP